MGITVNIAARSNRDWKTQFQFTDASTGNLIDFTGAFIAIGIEDQDGCPKLLATTTNGMVSIVSIGVIELDIPYMDMNLLPGSYPWGGYYQLNGDTVDLFEGSISIEKGIPKP